MHHGINPKYLDKNFGGILVIWDRIFGTYQPEEELAVYGVTHALRATTPFGPTSRRSVISPHYRIAAERPIDKLRAFIAHPAWRPVGAPALASPSMPSRATFQKYDPRASKKVAGYAFSHFLLLSAAGGAFMSFAEHASPGDLVAPAVVVLASALALVAISTPALGASARRRASDGRYRAGRVVRGGPLRGRCSAS